MNDNKVTIVGVCFLALCLGLMGGIFFLDGQLRILKEQYDDLEQSRANLEQDKNSLLDQIRVFKEAFAELETYNVRPAANDMDFYSQVQMEIDPYIRNNEVIIITSRQHGIRDGRTSISLTLRGDYYSFMRILAAWRNLHTTVRVSELSISASRTPQTSGEVLADIVLEAIIGAR